MALVYADQATFDIKMFDRSVRSILKHTRARSDQGEKISLSLGVWSTDQFDPLPSLEQALQSAEADLKEVSMTAEVS